MESIESKRRGRGQAWDEFVEGNLSIDDYTAKIQAKAQNRRGVKRSQRDALSKTVAISN